ncbi:MAG: baseplate wedge protein 53 [Thermoproteota archaeon]|nr:baseplate wedge protein 53 [Thermoproteota archaeon]
MYFSLHPHMEFDNQVVVDMFRRVIPHKNIIDNYAVLTTHDVKDQDTPETLAYELYGDSEYHWVILIINNIVNMRKDWPLRSREFGDFVSIKYPAPGQPDMIHHYEDEDGYVVDAPTAAELASGTNKLSITNFTYEERINEAKGKIKILKLEYLKLFVDNFKTLVA